MSWWSKTYNRPLKDPILLSYTLEELLYEFYDKIERGKVEVEMANEEAEAIEDKAIEEDEKWAEREAEKDRQKMMEEELERQKRLHGDGFGEDIIDDNFSGQKNLEEYEEEEIV